MSAIRKTRRAAVGLLCGHLLMWPPATLATTSAGFQVAVRLASTSQGACASAPSGGSTSSNFIVTCTSGHFVSMSPNALVDAALRLRLVRGPGGAADAARQTERSLPQEPPANVTAMHVSQVDGASDAQVEILVSF